MNKEIIDSINWQIQQYLPSAFREYIEYNFYEKLEKKNGFF